MSEYKVTKKRLKELQKSDDQEAAHSEADNLLCNLLIILGYEDIVKEYEKITRWCA